MMDQEIDKAGLRPAVEVQEITQGQGQQADSQEAIARAIALEKACGLRPAGEVAREIVQSVLNPPKPKRHMRKVRLSCLACGYVYETSVQVAEPKSLLRCNFGDIYTCPRCVAVSIAQIASGQASIVSRT